MKIIDVIKRNSDIFLCLSLFFRQSWKARFSEGVNNNCLGIWVQFSNGHFRALPVFPLKSMPLCLLNTTDLMVTLLQC